MHITDALELQQRNKMVRKRQARDIPADELKALRSAAAHRGNIEHSRHERLVAIHMTAKAQQQAAQSQREFSRRLVILGSAVALCLFALSASLHD